VRGNTTDHHGRADCQRAAAELSITSNLLSFSALSSDRQPVSQAIGLRKQGRRIPHHQLRSGCGQLGHGHRCSATLAAGPAVPVTVTADPTGLAAGFHRTTITVDSSAGTASIPVALLIAQNVTMSLSPAGRQFNMPAGSSPGNPDGSFLVSIAGGSDVSWNATAPRGRQLAQVEFNQRHGGFLHPGTVNFRSIPPSPAFSRRRHTMA